MASVEDLPHLFFALSMSSSHVTTRKLHPCWWQHPSWTHGSMPTSMPKALSPDAPSVFRATTFHTHMENVPCLTYITLSRGHQSIPQHFHGSWGPLRKQQIQPPSLRSPTSLGMGWDQTLEHPLHLPVFPFSHCFRSSGHKKWAPFSHILQSPINFNSCK